MSAKVGEQTAGLEVQQGDDRSTTLLERLQNLFVRKIKVLFMPLNLFVLIQQEFYI